jgi:hypothetical protein
VERSATPCGAPRSRWRTTVRTSVARWRRGRALQGADVGAPKAATSPKPTDPERRR